MKELYAVRFEEVPRWLGHGMETLALYSIVTLGAGRWKQGPILKSVGLYVTNSRNTKLLKAIFLCQYTYLFTALC